MSPADLTDSWPALPLAEWKDTYRTLHRLTQMVGKVPLALTPRTNPSGLAGAPVIPSSGKPLFGRNHGQALSLLESRPLRSGRVILGYAPR